MGYEFFRSQVDIIAALFLEFQIAGRYLPVGDKIDSVLASKNFFKDDSPIISI